MAVYPVFVRLKYIPLLLLLEYILFSDKLSTKYEAPQD